MSAARPAVLVLENGRVFRGTGFGAEGESLGEVVFNTAITGYQEIITDPSYAGQIVVMTAPQIGNTGTNQEDLEAARPACAGLAVREVALRPSSWRSEQALDRSMADSGLVGIEGIDTRALTRALRDQGAMRGAISTTAIGAAAEEELLARVRSSPDMTGLDLVPRVTCAAPYTWDEPSWSPPDQAARRRSRRPSCTSRPTTSASSATSCASCATPAAASPCCRPPRRPGTRSRSGRTATSCPTARAIRRR